MADLYPLSPSLFLDGYPQVDHALGLSSLPTSAPPQADQGKPGITTGENGKCLQNTFHVLWTQLGPDWLLIQTEMLRSSETWEEVNGQCRTFQNPHSTPAEEGALHSPEDHKLPRACCNTHQVVSCHRLPIFVTGHHHSSQPLFHVCKAISQSQHGHDLTGHCNVKLCLGQENRSHGQLRHVTGWTLPAVTAGGYTLWASSHSRGLSRLPTLSTVLCRGVTGVRPVKPTAQCNTPLESATV